MKFFVPFAADDAHAEQIWSDSRSDLFDLGLPTTKRRIWALSMHSSGQHPLLNIGRQFDPDEGPALIIFEASNCDAYYVCTPWRGVLGGEPHVLELCRHGRAIDFDGVIEPVRELHPNTETEVLLQLGEGGGGEWKAPEL